MGECEFVLAHTVKSVLVREDFPGTRKGRQILIIFHVIFLKREVCDGLLLWLGTLSSKSGRASVDTHTHTSIHPSMQSYVSPVHRYTYIHNTYTTMHSPTRTCIYTYMCKHYTHTYAHTYTYPHMMHTYTLGPYAHTLCSHTRMHTRTCTHPKM